MKLREVSGLTWNLLSVWSSWTYGGAPGSKNVSGTATVFGKSETTDFMGENLWVEKLAWFKHNEKPEVVLVMADTPELIKIVIAWASLEVKRADKLTELKGETENEAWQWLWENALYRLSELKEKIGIPFSELALGNKMKPLIGNRILYPDGTVNSYVQRYLREQVAKLFEVKSKRPAEKR